MDAKMLAKHLICRKNNVVLCLYHRALVRMVKTRRDGLPRGYAEALDNARNAACKPEGIFPLGNNARHRRAEERAAVVEQVHDYLSRTLVFGEVD